MDIAERFCIENERRSSFAAHIIYSLIAASAASSAMFLILLINVK